MSTIVKLVQGSAEWHEHRRHHRNASETPGVLGLSPWMTPYQLWQLKTGPAAAGGHSGDAARHPAGAAAREAYEKRPATSCSRWCWSTASTRPASMASPSMAG